MLKQILKHKEIEVKELLQKKQQQIEHVLKRPSLIHALKQPGLQIIAEIKRQSPSAGSLAKISDPIDLAKRYQEGGAAGISILTDKHYFNGSLQDLSAVAKEIRIPLLRKEFIIHPVQIIETVNSGASAILLIVAALGNKTKEFLELAHDHGLEGLVEVHDDKELEIALDAGSRLIGVNSRNLKTMKVDLKTAEKMVKQIPIEIVKVAESGIQSIEDAQRMKECGYDGVLIGEFLVKSDDPASLIQQMRGL
jgi:indole-3-glycerol phosphate synthase